MSAAELTRRHHRQQLALRAVTVRELLLLARMWDGTAVSWEPFSLALLALVELRRRGSAGLTTRYYVAHRALLGVAGDPTPRFAEFGRGTAWNSLTLTGLRQVERGMRAGRTLTEARDVALVTLSGSASRLALNGGRETLVESLRADRRAKGWRRVLGPKPCDFCSMLASRGPVFKDSTVGFQAHDHCSCAGEPVY